MRKKKDPAERERPQREMPHAHVLRAAARSAVYEGGSLPGLMAVRVFAGHVVFL